MTLTDPDSFAADEELEQVADEGERNDVQKMVDAQFKAAHEAWAAAGKVRIFTSIILIAAETLPGKIRHIGGLKFLV